MRIFSSSGTYSLPILGDTHFDGTDTALYHEGWKPRDADDLKWRKREFARNAEMWRERLPHLVAASAAASRPGDVLLLQLGDLVQGDCPGAETETRMFRDAIAACRKGFGRLPFLTVAGNHDVRNGGREPYDRFFPPFLSDELSMRVDSTTFRFAIGPDAWIVADFMKPDPDRVFSALEECKGARRLFFVCHSPVTPTDNWGFYWFLFGKPEDTEKRRLLRKILSEREAIVLCGHTHRTELDEWRTPDGLLTQFTANSVWRSPAQATPRVQADDPASWGSLFVEKHASDKPEEHDGHWTTRTRAESLALMGEYRDGLVRYAKYDAAGHFRLNVSEKSVSVDFFGGDATTATRRFVLRG